MNLRIFQFNIPKNADRMIMEYTIFCNKSWKTP